LALKLGFDEFSFRLKAPIHEMDLADTVRVDVAIQHRTRAWQTVEVDLGPTSSMLWRPELETLATQLSFPVSSAAEIERMFRETVGRIATSP
jgi:hypothetical protein